jgi:glycosyltransferase involved in cell wall biosynthesis
MDLRFTIVTSTFNAGTALATTARSLQAQTFRNFEWLVIDGASQDDTVAIAGSFGDLVTVLVSEKDTGIYNAWNKALPLMRGEWVLFLGAGDTLYAPDTLEKVAGALGQLDPGITTAYGIVTVADTEAGIDLRVRDLVWRGLRGPWGGGRPLLPCHQGVFQRSRVFSGFHFDERCRISADNEVLLRELVAGRGAKLDVMVARFEGAGISSNPENRLRMVSESVYINWKIGIFRHRPVYQLAVLAINAAKHGLLKVLRTMRP